MKSPFEMSLGGQFADLDRAYRHCCEDKLTLLGRCAELEELVSDAECILEDAKRTAIGKAEFPYPHFHAWQKRVRALLHEGKEEHNA